MSELEQLPNIGKTLARELEQAGITSREELENSGSLEALLKIKGQSGKGCYNMLYALEGAIQGVRWHSLGKEQRKQLKMELDLAFDDQE